MIVGEWISNTFDICSSASQGHSWILVAFDLLGRLRVIVSGRGGKDPFDTFIFCSMTGFVWYDVGCR